MPPSRIVALSSFGGSRGTARTLLLGLLSASALQFSACGTASTPPLESAAGAGSSARAGTGGTSGGGAAPAGAASTAAGSGGVSSSPAASGGGGLPGGAAGAAGANLGGRAGVSGGGAAGASNAGFGGSAGSSGGASGAAGCSGVFCEDFEHGALDPAIWETQASGTQPIAAVQSAVVAHGKYAAQFHAKVSTASGTKIGQSYDFMLVKNPPAALLGHHFGRASFNASPKPPALHTEFLFAGGKGFPKLKFLEVAGIGDAWQLTFVDLIGGGESYASGGSAPHGRWICLEWEFNDAPDQITVFVDGVQSYSRTSITFEGQSSGLVGGFSSFGFGYYDWHPATYEFDIYYDDIVLDTKRVGCLPK